MARQSNDGYIWRILYEIHIQLANKIEDIDVKHAMMKKCIRITKQHDRDLKSILTNEIKERGEVIHESTIFREMIQSFICDYYADKTHQPLGTLSAYIDQAISNNENVDIPRIARIFNTTPNVVRVTKSGIMKRRRANVI